MKGLFAATVTVRVNDSSDTRQARVMLLFVYVFFSLFALSFALLLGF